MVFHKRPRKFCNAHLASHTRRSLRPLATLLTMKRGNGPALGSMSFHEGSASVARMERSAIRVSRTDKARPGPAPLHPGYARDYDTDAMQGSCEEFKKCGT